MMGKQNCECSCCHRRHAHLQLVKGYQQGVHLKQNITTKDKNEYESDFGGRSRVGVGIGVGIGEVHRCRNRGDGRARAMAHPLFGVGGPVIVSGPSTFPNHKSMEIKTKRWSKEIVLVINQGARVSLGT